VRDPRTAGGTRWCGRSRGLPAGPAGSVRAYRRLLAGTVPWPLGTAHARLLTGAVPRPVRPPVPGIAVPRIAVPEIPGGGGCRRAGRSVHRHRVLLVRGQVMPRALRYRRPLLSGLPGYRTRRPARHRHARWRGDGCRTGDDRRRGGPAGTRRLPRGGRRGRYRGRCGRRYHGLRAGVSAYPAHGHEPAAQALAPGRLLGSRLGGRCGAWGWRRRARCRSRERGRLSTLDGRRGARGRRGRARCRTRERGGGRLPGPRGLGRARAGTLPGRRACRRCSRRRARHGRGRATRPRRRVGRAAPASPALRGRSGLVPVVAGAEIGVGVARAAQVGDPAQLLGGLRLAVALAPASAAPGLLLIGHWSSSSPGPPRTTRRSLGSRSATARSAPC